MLVAVRGQPVLAQAFHLVRDRVLCFQSLYTLHSCPGSFQVISCLHLPLCSGNIGFTDVCFTDPCSALCRFGDWNSSPHASVPHA